MAKREATNLQGVGSNAGPAGKTPVATNLGGQAGNSLEQGSVTITNCPKCGWPVVTPGSPHVCRGEPMVFYDFGELTDRPFSLDLQKGESDVRGA